MVWNGLRAYIFFVRLPDIIRVDTPASAASTGIGLRKLTDREIEELINALHNESSLWLTSSPPFSNRLIRDVTSSALQSLKWRLTGVS